MWLTRLLAESWEILRESAFFILAGFVMAAAIHVLMARGQWADYLRKKGMRSILLATAVGLPMPLCSCSVLPAAISLRRQGASKGATLSFLISTPETSFESVFLTYSLIGPFMAIIRLIAGFAIAIVAGVVEDFLALRYDRPGAEPTAGQPTEPSAEACGECCSDHVHALPGEGANRELPSWREGFRFAFVEIFDDVMGWMVVGIVAAAAIQVLLPPEVLQTLFGSPLQAMVVMVLIGIPMYVCAEASTPIAAAFIAQGVSPGAALVFILAGPASNIGSIGVLLKEMGRRTVAVYLVSIAVVSIAAGLLTDWVLASRGVNLQERALEEPFLPDWLKTAGAVVFIVLSLASAWRLGISERVSRMLTRVLPVTVTPRRLRWSVAIVALAAWLASGFVIIEPGQLGMLKRFGRVYHAEAGPGLHYVAPWPIGDADVLETARVFRLASKEFAESRPGRNVTPDEETVNWILLGDENIANIKYAAHWRMKPGAAGEFAYGAADREALVRHAVGAAVRQNLAAESIDTVYTVAQSKLADQVQAEAQATLDACACGIELVGLLFLDVHAPTEVHEAFRDVASALEDQATRRNKALAYRAGLTPMALGTKAQILFKAEGDRARSIAEAQGQAERFRAVRAAYADYPNVTRLRMILETYDRVLPGRPKCIKPSGANLYLDLRYGAATATRDLRMME